jgi:cell division protein FtsB
MGIRIKWKPGSRSLARKGQAFWRALYVRRRTVATAGVCLLAGWLFYHVVFGANGMIVYQKKRLEYGALQEEVKGLQGQNDRYTRDINSLKSNPEAIEREAREQLRYAKPGEVIYILPSDNREKPAVNTAKK